MTSGIFAGGRTPHLADGGRNNPQCRLPTVRARRGPVDEGGARRSVRSRALTRNSTAPTVPISRFRPFRRLIHPAVDIQVESLCACGRQIDVRCGPRGPGDILLQIGTGQFGSLAGAALSAANPSSVVGKRFMSSRNCRWPVERVDLRFGGLDLGFPHLGEVTRRDESARGR